MDLSFTRLSSQNEQKQLACCQSVCPALHGFLQHIMTTCLRHAVGCSVTWLTKPFTDLLARRQLPLAATMPILHEAQAPSGLQPSIHSPNAYWFVGRGVWFRSQVSGSLSHSQTCLLDSSYSSVQRAKSACPAPASWTTPIYLFTNRTFWSAGWGIWFQHNICT